MVLSGKSGCRSGWALHFLLSKCEAGKVRKCTCIYTHVCVYKSTFVCVCVYVRTVALEIPVPDYFDLLTKC